MFRKELKIEMSKLFYINDSQKICLTVLHNFHKWPLFKLMFEKEVLVTKS